jgi:uncharacterized DUF497 family protein
MFDWDPRKAKSNRLKHGVSFEEATTAFLDPARSVITYSKTAQKVQRRGARLIDESRRTPVVRRSEAMERNEAYEAFSAVFTMRRRDDEKITRIISARRASRKERKKYEVEED